MAAGFATVDAVTYIGFVPLAAAFAGIVTTARLGGAIITSRSELSHNGGLFSIVSLDLIAFITIVALLCLIWRDGWTKIETVSLAVVTLFQGVIALTAYKRSRAISQIRDTLKYQRQDNVLKPGDRRNSRDCSGISFGAPATAESQLMSQSNHSTKRENRSEFVELGRRHYEALLPKIGIEHNGEFVAISVKTGRYETASDVDNLKKFAEALTPGDFLWIARIGSI